jgi:hypothetical protein
MNDHDGKRHSAVIKGRRRYASLRPASKGFLIKINLDEKDGTYNVVSFEFPATFNCTRAYLPDIGPLKTCLCSMNRSCRASMPDLRPSRKDGAPNADPELSHTEPKARPGNFKPA